MRIVTDVFPAHVVAVAAGVFESPWEIESDPPSPEGHYVGKARVVLTEKTIVVAIDSPEGAVIAFRETYVDYIKSNKQTENSFVTTESGKMIAFKKDLGCGCGSRLRSWHAYNTLTALEG